jgi:ribonuclease VapC
MVIDTSAIVAIALDELEAADFERRIADDPVRLISAATFFRGCHGHRITVRRDRRQRARSLAAQGGVEIVPVGAEHATGPAAPGAASAADVTQLASTSAIASPMRWRR